MKKVLIWNSDIPLKNAGGPGGYLYNIHEYLKSNPCEQIVFLSELLGKSQNTGYPSKLKKIIYDISDKFCVFAFLLDIYMLHRMYKRKKISVSIDLNQYDVIHFHNVFNLINYRAYLNNYKGKIMLTSHMPEPPIAEISHSFRVIGPFLRKHQEFVIQP